MFNPDKFDKSLVGLYNIIFNLNFSDLMVTLSDESLYSKSNYEFNHGDELDYNKLNLNEYQQEVIKNYILFLSNEEDTKLRITYLKAVEHTIKFVKDTEYLYNNTPKK